MAQNYIGQITDTSTESGDDLAARLNDFDNAHRTNQSGATRPAGSLAGAIWTRVAAGVYDLMMFNGTKDVAVLTGDGNLAGLTDTEAAQANLGLGTAAVVDHGTAPGQVPLNSNLGTMAVEDATNYVPQSAKATKAQAEGGTTGDVWMDDIRVREAIAKWAIGVGQGWSNPSRSANTSYQNSTGRPIMVAIKSGGSGANDRYMQVSANNSTWVGVGVTAGTGQQAQAFIVPAGYYYRIAGTVGAGSIDFWSELR